MGIGQIPLGLSSILVLASTMVSPATADMAKGREECTEQLVGLATCLPYVGGDAKAPTPDCCSGLKQVLKTNKKCLCVIVKDRNDPQMGLNINATLALGLPAVCHASANVSQCPALLHLAPNSPDAQVFFQFASGSNGSASVPGHNGYSASANSEGSRAQEKNCIRKRWFGLEVIVAALIWCLCLP